MKIGTHAPIKFEASFGCLLRRNQWHQTAHCSQLASLRRGPPNLLEIELLPQFKSQIDQFCFGPAAGRQNLTRFAEGASRGCDSRARQTIFATRKLRIFRQNVTYFGLSFKRGVCKHILRGTARIPGLSTRIGDII